MKVAAPLLAVAVLLVIGAVAIEVLIHQQKQISSQPTVAATPQSRDPLFVDLGTGVKMEFVWIAALNGWVGKYEVTNEEYRRFKADHNSGEYNGHSLNSGRQPVVQVSYYGAVAFAERVNNTGKLPDGYKARLPDGKEWLTFAQCGDGRKYPWGNEWPPKYGNYADVTTKKYFADWGVIDGYDDGEAVSCAVEKSGKNDWGLYGVGGNAWEWTSELFDSTSDFRGLRGASWDSDGQDYLSCSNSSGNASSGHDYRFGIRLVVLR